MLCEKCNKNQATFHYAEVINGVRSEHHLCSECAVSYTHLTLPTISRV